MEKLSLFREKIVHIMANVSGRAKPDAEIVLLAILWYIVIIVLFVIIHRRILRKHKRLHENIVLLYDTIRYQIAKTQAKNPSIQNNTWIKIVMDSAHQNYLAKAQEIQEEITDMEQKLGEKIITADQRTSIKKQSKAKRTMMLFVQVIGQIVTVLTVGIYKLFW